jgi:hypothetical protein
MRTITLRAPIDGTVHEIAPVNSEVRAGISPALVEFEKKRAARSGEPLSKAYDFQGLSPQAGGLLYKVQSDILELQLSEESRKLEQAKQRLSHLEAQRNFELGSEGKSGVAQRELERLELKLWSDWEYFGNFTGGATITRLWGEQRAATLTGPLKKVQDLELEIARAKHEFLKVDWESKLTSANQELASAVESVKNAQLQIRFGEVYSSEVVRVTKIHVLRFQYVTKGEAILDVSTQS